MIQTSPTIDFKIFIKKLLRKVGLLLCSILLLICFYIYKDPYCDFGVNKTDKIQYYFQNISDFSVKKLDQTKIHYNTFIFGSSRSIPFYSCYVKHKIFRDKSTVIPFHFANWGDRIRGIERKLKYLDAKGFKLNNIFILLDNSICFLENGDVKKDESYKISRKTWLEASTNHFLYFFYYSGKNLPKNIRILVGLEKEIDQMYVDDFTNDLNHVCPTKHVESVFYAPQKYINLQTKLPPRNGIEHRQPNRINPTIENYLKQIKFILNKHNSKYVIIYTPMYDQYKFGKKDETILDNYFHNHIIDFSGVNTITNRANEYSDPTHYFPIIGKRMIDSISKTSLFNAF
jgi:hypothetical protein